MDLRRLASVSRWLGPGVAVVAGVFVVRVLGREWGAARQALQGASLRWVVVAAALALAAMVAMALPWGRALSLLDAPLPLSEVVGLYFAGEIGKYLPGGVWPVVGRGELAHRAGMSRSSAYASVVLSLASLYLAAALVAGLLVLAAGGSSRGGVLLAVGTVAAAGVAALHPRLLHLGVSLAGRVVRRPLSLDPVPWRASLALVGLYLPAWALAGAATWAVARSLQPSAPLFEIGAAAVASWLAGFLVVGVPGGVGVREATFVALAPGLSGGTAAAVAVVARLLFVAVDAAGAVVALPRLRRLGVNPTGAEPAPRSTEADGGPR